MTQHSLLKAFKSAFAVFVFMQVSPSYSQVNYGCPITIDGTEGIASIRSGPSGQSMVSNYATHFDKLENLRGLDKNLSTIELDSKMSSDLIYVNDFGFSLPSGVNILGIDIRVVGEASIPNVIRDTRISLANGPGMSLGHDKANKSSSKPWGDNASWAYGSVLDNWGTMLTPATINDPAFGVLLQISNRGTESVSAGIDQVSLNVYYQAPIELCSHPCVALHSYKNPEVLSYTWNVTGMVSEASNQEDNIVNIFAEDAPFGEYEVCLTRSFLDGSSENCCRPLSYQSCETGSIGDRIWEDTNGNGLQDPGEHGLDNYTVWLYDSSGREIGRTVSVDGNYIFNDIKPGLYVIRVDTKYLVPTIYNAENLDNNSDAENIYFYGSTGVIELGAGENRTDIDLGLTQYASICGHTFNDRDADGWENGEDVVLPGVKVNLYDMSCVFITSVLSDANGDFCLGAIGAGNYLIDYELPEGYFPSSFGVSNVIDPVTGKILLDLTDGEDTFMNDLGAFRLSEIGDSIWNDANANGIQDSDESGIEGVLVELYNCSDDLIRTTLSDVDGHYLFEGLTPGSYKICVDGNLFGFAPTIQSNDINGSDLSAEGCSDCVEILDNVMLHDLDAGFVERVVLADDIGDLIWLDDNGNGIQDAGEQGVSGVTVMLQDCAGNLLSSTLTDSLGHYLFEDVTAGDYEICYSEDYAEFTPGISGVCTSCFSHTATMPLLDKDLSLSHVTSNVDINIWIDENGNGLRDDNEELVSGLVTELVNCNSVIVSSSVTDSLGTSIFTDVFPGEYYIRVVLSSGFTFITNGGMITGQNGDGTSDCFNLSGSGQTVNVGLTRQDSVENSICARIWEDLNSNNVIDPGELLLSDVGVEIYTCQGILVGSSITNSEAEICIALQSQEDYYIRIIAPTGYSPVFSGIITNAFGVGTSDCFTITDQITYFDIGLIGEQLEEVSICTSIWEDRNQDNVRDSDEPLLPNLTVDLYTCQGVLVESYLTNDIAEACLQGLASGDYYLSLMAPIGYTFSNAGIITNAFGPGTTDCISVAGQTFSIDIGVVSNEVAEELICARVWDDINVNNVIDPGEELLSEVNLDLYTCLGTYVATITSSELSAACLEGLSVGEYYLSLSLPSGYNYSSVGAITNAFGIGTTDCFGLSGQIFSIDLGLVKEVAEGQTICTRVWEDINENNVVDLGEQLLENLIVDLYSCTGGLIGSFVTDALSEVCIENLAVGDYYLSIEAPGDYSPTSVSAINNEFGPGTTSCITVTGQTVSIDIGLSPEVEEEEEVSLVVSLWLDSNTNGINEAGEPTLSSVSVGIFSCLGGTLIEQSVSNANGTVSFENLAPGEYYISTETLPGLQFLTGGVITNFFGLGSSDCFDVNSKDQTIEVAYVTAIGVFASISGEVWFDEDENGLIDLAENGMDAIDVRLYNENFQVLNTTTTNNEGEYTFDDLDLGSYYIQFATPSNYTYTSYRAGVSAGNDSEVIDSDLGMTDVVELFSGGAMEHVNAGLVESEIEYSSVSGRIWLDENSNGLIDIDEEGWAESLVVLFDENGTYHSTTFSDEDGYYTFPLLNRGRYFIDFELPIGYDYSPSKIAGVSEEDSEVVDPVNGTTLVFDLNTVAGLAGINAGLQTAKEEEVSIAGKVWLDADNNNLLSANEDGYPESLVVLFDEFGTYHSATFTDADGYYSFPQLVAGSYYLNFELPEGYQFSLAQVSNDDLDSEVMNIIEGTTPLYNLMPGDFMDNINVGLQEINRDPSSIAGRVWIDADKNNLINDTESGYDEMMVILFDEAGEYVAASFTNEEGFYSFGQLAPGSYFLDFELPEGYNYSGAGAGNNNLDSEVIDVLSGTTGVFTIEAGENLEGINAGLQLKESNQGSIEGIVWVDGNSNNLLDNDEIGYPDLLVVLQDENGNYQASTFTNQEGVYVFPLLNHGRYIVDFDLPDTYLFVESKVAGSSDLDSEVVDLISGATGIIDVSTDRISGVNAGIRTETEIIDPGSISGRVWRDQDADGLIGFAESGIQGVVVELIDNNNLIVASTSTIWSGHYDFPDLAEGLYYVRFELQGDAFSDPQVGGNTNQDSEVVNRVRGVTALFFLNEGEDLSGVNAGMIMNQLTDPSTISGRVWLDVDADGLIGSSELGLSGVGVALLDNTNTIVTELLTSPNGSYSFTNLAAGLYYVKFDVTDYNYTLPKAGGASDEDSEVVNRVNGNTVLYILEEGEALTGINAGLTEITDPILGSIGGRVWIDIDEDGMIGTEELGADKITVELLDDTNEVVAVTETLSTGNYEFNGLDAGLYYVRFMAQDYEYTIPQAGGSSIWDSEVVNSIGGNTALFVLAAGENVVGVNAGVVPLVGDTGTMGGIVWMDTDQDGLISGVEGGVADIVVHLINSKNEVVALQTTAADGLYKFEDLLPGLYYFRYEIPGSTYFTVAQAGGDSEIDSDVVNRLNANTALYVLKAGDNLTGINAGIYEVRVEPVSIAGRVWLDEDKDGMISTNESGIENITVELVDESNQLVNTQLTDATGAYLFDGIDAGLYHVRFVIGSEYDFTSPKVGGNSDLDSEVLNTTAGKTANYILASGESLGGINAGLIEIVIIEDKNAISGIAWEDLNGDGVLGSGEYGAQGVPVRLLDSEGNLKLIVSTNGLGEYMFSDLEPGDYYIEFTMPLDSKATDADQSTNELLDSDISDLGMTELVSLTGSEVTGMNGGYYYPVSIGDYVWLDMNEDGMQSPDEPGANNYIVNLYDGNDNFLDRAWSNYNAEGSPGYYSFNDLRPGDYYIQISPQSGMDYSPSGQTDDENDSDLTGENGYGSSATFFMASGDSTVDKDIGLVLAPASLGDRLWLDENGDGIQDDVEKGLNNVVVELYNSNDVLMGTTITASKDGKDGYYLFEDIYPTEYYVKFIISDDYITTVADIGGVDSADSDIDHSNGPGTTSIFLLSPGEADLDVDGGVYLNAFIGDLVWHDKNKDGMQDANEPGVENVGISLYKMVSGESSYIGSTLTDRFGLYRFSNLANGDYYLIFEPADDFEMTDMNMGSDRTIDSDASKTGVTSLVTIESNTSVSNVDVGLIRPDNQLSGFAWFDLNQNGTFETDEAFVEGVDVWLMKGTTFIDEAITGPGGRYLFEGLSNDDYYMKVELPSEYDFTTPNFGIDEDLDSDFDYSGNSETFTFTGSDVFRNINLGLIEGSKKKSTLYPNPIIGPELNISSYLYKDDLSSSYQIIGSMGEVILSGDLANGNIKGSQQYRILVEGLEAGIYFLKLRVGKQVENLKFTKLSR